MTNEEDRARARARARARGTKIEGGGTREEGRAVGGNPPREAHPSTDPARPGLHSPTVTTDITPGPESVTMPPPASSVSGALSIEPGDPAHYLNRELSWIEFNGRVLAEAASPDVPLFERL